MAAETRREFDSELVPHGVAAINIATPVRRQDTADTVITHKLPCLSVTYSSGWTPGITLV